jgi:hypothetical protein
MIKHSLVRATRSTVINNTLYDIDIEYTKSVRLFGIKIWSRYYKTNGDISVLNQKQPIGLRQHEKTN